jgi:hypothetical protein
MKFLVPPDLPCKIKKIVHFGFLKGRLDNLFKRYILDGILIYAPHYTQKPYSRALRKEISIYRKSAAYD